MNVRDFVSRASLISWGYSLAFTTICVAMEIATPGVTNPVVPMVGFAISIAFAGTYIVTSKEKP